jgi:hypothetical protein
VLVEGRRVVVRPRPWRHLPVALFVVMANAIAVYGYVRDTLPHQGAWFAAGLISAWAIFIAEAAWARIIVTSKEVRAISAHRNPPVPRERITHIRALRWTTVFYDNDRNELLKIGVDLSRDQLLALGGELDVTVWDHRAWLGIKELKHGVNLTANAAPQVSSQTDT